MVDLKEFIASIISVHAESPKANVKSIIAFLEDNAWFGIKPAMVSGRVMLNSEQVDCYTPPLALYLTTEATCENIYKLMQAKFPTTAQYWEKFCKVVDVPEDEQFYILDFMLAFCVKDIMLYSDTEIKNLVKQASMELTKSYGDTFTFFLSWLRKTTKTGYRTDFVMQKRFQMDFQNEAYSMDEYLELMYYVFNDDYIYENEMYKKAAESKDYADAWLYFCMHYVCSLRLTDLQRIYHPKLMYPPDEILRRIASDSFSDADARMILLSITVRLATLPFTPSKTEKIPDVGSIHFSIPHSCETHFGKLFALAEAHRQIAGTPDEPIIRKVAKYEEIKRAMGDEIGSLFREYDFRSRSATKSYLQSIFMNSDPALGNKKATVKGYILASIARTHKSGYGSFAETTIEYIKDMKLNGYDSKFVAYELLERGVLSFIPGMLLSVLTSRQFDDLNVKGQTALIKELNLSPFETNSTISTIVKGRNQAQRALAQAIESGEDVITTLQRIASGQAFSKQADCLCLCSACGKVCPYTTRRQCVGCEYEISTKSTLFLLISECKRMKHLYDTSSDANEREKYKYLMCSVILPKLSEMLTCLKNNYGEECYTQYADLLQQYTAQI